MKLLWLDDYRNPFKEDWLSKFAPAFQDKIISVFWVKNYSDFTEWINKNGLPSHICFDHDLVDEHYTPEKYWDDYKASKEYQDRQVYKEKTGLDCAKWLIKYCMGNNKPLPLFVVHSANPVGADNIRKLLYKFMSKRYFNPL